MADKAEPVQLVPALLPRDVGPAIEQIKALVEDHFVPQLIEVVDPITGVKAPASIGRSGVLPVPVSVFDEYQTNPRWRHGAARFTSIDSLIAHVNRFKDADSVLFAVDDRQKPAITGVLDYHPAGASSGPRWGAHKSVFDFPLSDEWKAWAAMDKKPMRMADFAVFLEDRIVDVLDLIHGEDKLPEDLQKFVNAVGGRIASAAQLLEISIGLKVNEKSAVEEAFNQSTGEATLHFAAEHVDGSGRPLKVPNLFLIGIPVFKNDQFYRIAARLRYRKTTEGLVFWYELWRADRVFDTAFREGCERVRVETDLPLLFGTPE